MAYGAMASAEVFDSMAIEEAGDGWAGDSISKNNLYSNQQIGQLDTKYEGTVAIDTWTGYAVKIVSKTGGRRVEVGPCTIQLDYDETLEKMQLSTGKPKNTDSLFETVFLRVKNNKVSDVISAETKDLVNVNVKLSYRVNFEGDSKKWFDVENYVKFLCDHLRSRLRNAIKRLGTQEFTENAIDIVRNTVLGIADEETHKRPGQVFEDNGMVVREVEVLDVVLGDEKIASMMKEAQHESVRQSIERSRQQSRLKMVTEQEEVAQSIAYCQAETKVATDAIIADAAKRIRTAEIASEQHRAVLANSEDSIQKSATIADKERRAILGAARQAEIDQDLAKEKAEAEIFIDKLMKETEAHKEKLVAITPELTAALAAVGEEQLALSIAKAASPLAMLGGNNVVDVLQRIFPGKVLDTVKKFLEQEDSVTVPRPRTPTARE